VEDANYGYKTDVQKELHNHTSLEEGEASPDGAVGGVGVKERGGSLRGKGDNNKGYADWDDAEIYWSDRDRREVGGKKAMKKEV